MVLPSVQIKASDGGRMKIQEFEIRMALRGRQTDCLLAAQTVERDVDLLKDLLIKLKDTLEPATVRFYMKRISQSEDMCRYFTNKYGELTQILDGEQTPEKPKGGMKMTLEYDSQMRRTAGDASLIVEITKSGGLESAKAFCEVFEDYVDCTDRISKDELKMKKIWADVDYSAEAEKEQYLDLAK